MPVLCSELCIMFREKSDPSLWARPVVSAALRLVTAPGALLWGPEHPVLPTLGVPAHHLQRRGPALVLTAPPLPLQSPLGVPCMPPTLPSSPGLSFLSGSFPFSTHLFQTNVPTRGQGCVLYSCVLTPVTPGMQSVISLYTFHRTWSPDPACYLTCIYIFLHKAWISGSIWANTVVNQFILILAREHLLQIFPFYFFPKKY